MIEIRIRHQDEADSIRLMDWDPTEHAIQAETCPSGAHYLDDHTCRCRGPVPETSEPREEKP